MFAHKDPDFAETADPPSRISSNNPLKDLARGNGVIDPWLLARSEDMTRQLNALQHEYVDHQSDVADRAKDLWDEIEIDKAEKLARRLHSKNPGPVTSALRLTLEGTKLLIREWYDIIERLVSGGSSLNEVDRLRAMNLLGVGFNSRCVPSEVEPPWQLRGSADRCAYVHKFVMAQIAKLQAKLPGLERISARQRERQMGGQPAPNDKIANRLTRAINTAENILRRIWTTAQRLKAQLGTQATTPSSYETNPISDQPTQMITPSSKPNPISQPPVSSSSADQ